MKLKSFLLGSAAAMMAVSTSQAADAIVEDEAVEYVRVCETFGRGYFFIPGTETCIKIGGDVRVEYKYLDFAQGVDDRILPGADLVLGTADDVFAGGPGSGDGEFRYRARVEVSTATETDLGTVTTFARLEGAGNGEEGNFDNIPGDSIFEARSDISDGVVRLDQAILGIGGFSTGYGDNYWSRNIGFGLVGGITDGLYGYGQSIYAEYTYEIAGFAVTAGIEQFEDGNITNIFGVPDPAENPNIYVGANYGASFGSIGVTAYYDQVRDEFDFNVGVQLKPLEGLNLEAFYLTGDGVYTINAGGGTVGVNGERFTPDYAFGVGAGYTFGDVTPYVLYTGTDGFFDDYVSVGAFWKPSGTGLTFQAEATFFDDDGGVLEGSELYSLRLRRAF